MMKQLLILLTLFIGVHGFGQTPIITMISDGDCSGGNPKVVEIYADGAVDFANYSLELQSNANTSWGNTLNLADLGTVTDDFVYVHKDDPSFASEFPSATNTLATGSSVVNFNGDDRIRIIEDASGNTIDQYGVDSVDGSGEAWEYKDGYAKRNDGTGPESTFFVGNWTFSNGALDGEGTCQGGSAFETIIGIGTYSTSGGSNDPEIAVSSPADGTTFAPGTAQVEVDFSTLNTSDNDQVDIDVNGTVTQDISSPYSIQTADGQTYNVTLDLISGGNVVDSQSLTFDVGDANQVPDVFTLRNSSQDGTFYELTGEAVLTYQQDFRNQKYIEDATGAILIDDPSGVIQTTYNVGDGISGIVGTLSEFGGVVQFIPESDPGAASSTDNTITPQVITINEFNTNFEDYESELVAFEDVTFTSADGTLTFQNGDVYPIEDVDGNATLVEALFNMSYTDTTVPTGTINVAGLASDDFGDFRILPRDNDIDITLGADSFNNENVQLYPNPVTNGQLTIRHQLGTQVQLNIYSINGKRLMSQSITQHETINVSHLNTGIYFLNLINDSQKLTQKIIIK